MSFGCVECGYVADTFNAKPVGVEGGALTYRASCPKCGSHLVNAYGEMDDLSLSGNPARSPLGFLNDVMRDAERRAGGGR